MSTNYNALMQEINNILEKNGLANFSATELVIVEHPSAMEKSNFSILDLENKDYVIAECRIIYDVIKGEYIKHCD